VASHQSNLALTKGGRSGRPPKYSRCEMVNAMVDVDGLLLQVLVHAANIQERAGACFS
jgi:hypothetical protein